MIFPAHHFSLFPVMKQPDSTGSDWSCIRTTSRRNLLNTTHYKLSSFKMVKTVEIGEVISVKLDWRMELDRKGEEG